MNERAGRVLKDYEPSQNGSAELFRPRASESFSQTPVQPAGVGNVHGTGSSMKNELPSGGGGPQTGAFYGMYVNGDGDTMLQGGTCTGGDGTETFIDIKVIDASTGPIQSAGYVMYIEATGNGVTANNVLLPGWNQTDASIAYDASVVPNDTLPIGSSATGKTCHIRIGSFTETGFQPDNFGNIHISFCPGSYSISRA